MIQEGPDKISCLVMETMQGGGGVIETPKGYLKGIRELCTKYGILMVCDEVMVGFGRDVYKRQTGYRAVSLFNTIL